MRVRGMAALAAIVSIVAVRAPALASSQDQTAQAKRAYERAIELDKRGDASGSLSLLWEASGLAPNDPEIQNTLGEALERNGALGAALDAFRRAVAARPGFRKAENNLILTLVKAGQGPESLERARALVAASPNDPERLFTLSLAQSEQEVEGAIATLRRVLTIDPRHMLARYNLALVLKRVDRLAEATGELQKAIAIESRAETQYTLGTIYRQQGDLDRAVDSLREAIRINSQYVDAHATLGSVLQAKGDSAAAVAALTRAIALAPDQPAPRYGLAHVLQQMRDPTAARRALDDAERLRVRAARAHEALVWTSVGIEKVRTGDLSSALGFFRRAIATSDAYAPAHYQEGLVLHRLGQHEAARAAFATAKRLNPSLVSPYETTHKYY
jgi:tetratricopeptide (TPR) repeat protein